MKYIFVLLIVLANTLAAVGQSSKYEIRAVWLTTLQGLDWPRQRAWSAVTMEKQKKELTTLLDCLKEANFNTVLLQTRIRGNVIYPSSIEPFNSVFSGKEGVSPGYDPLKFAIEECHKRGMECHAWLVTIPLAEHRIKDPKYRGCNIRYKQKYYMNPGNPLTKEYLAKIAKEITAGYDIDGIHLDYIRYPEHAPDFPDYRDFRKSGKGMSKEEWKRDNITRIVREVYKEVKNLKPWVKVSSSPIGKLRDTSRYTSNGWNAYKIVSQDVKRWIDEGIQDLLFPMMYFKGNNFYPFALDWKESSHERPVVPGLGIYFLDPREGNWDIQEVERQINFVRKYKLGGESFYRADFLMKNTQNIYQLLVADYYRHPALIPPMKWEKSAQPQSVQGLKIESVKDGYFKISWKNQVSDEGKRRYIIYASDNTPVDVSNPENIMAAYIEGDCYMYVPLLPWERKHHFALTAVDRYGNESAPAEVSLP